jgi:hypothetical protein
MMVSEFTDSPLQLDETKEIQDKLKITLPKNIKVRNHLIWKPIVSSKIEVTVTDKDGNISVDIQDNRKINRKTISKVYDLVDFIWKEVILPKGENSCLPVLYQEGYEIWRLEKNNKIYINEYSFPHTSQLAYDMIQELKKETVEKPQDHHHSPTVNNQLEIELFKTVTQCKKNYDKFTQPIWYNREKDRIALEEWREDWIKNGIFDDARTLEQVFAQFPETDQPLFEDYHEFVANLNDIKNKKIDRNTKSRKLGFAYDLILIGIKNIPNNMKFYNEEVENPDFGKFSEKD